MNKVMPDTLQLPDEPVLDATPNGSVQLENGTIGSKTPSDSGKPDTAVISYHDLNYDVSVSKACCRSTKKQILHNLSGMFLPGMNAIMGPTGSGKTTLLDVVAGRTEHKGIHGDLLVNGRPPPDNFKFMTGYVIQDDVVVGTLTVRENLMFSANLRLPSSKSHNSKKRRVQKTINELGLTRCADTKVGTEFTRGVSGGERKRTNIGMELIIKPTILFLDEPTTGLDSSTANAVISLLHSLSRRGRTVIFSIHQPRYSIYKLFDRLTLLAAGRTVFHGPASEALDFFNALGYKCEEFNNPPDFFLDTINGDSSALKSSLTNVNLNGKLPVSPLQVAETKEIGGPRDEASKSPNGDSVHVVEMVHESTLAEQLALSFRESDWSTRVIDELQPILTEYEQDLKNGKKQETRSRKGYYATSVFRQFGYVSQRIFLNLTRNTQTTLVQLGSAIFFAVIVGIIYLQLNFAYPSGLQDRVGALFFIAVNQLFSSTSGIDLFIRERVFFVHENASGFYRVSAYFFGKIICDFIPMRLIPLIVFSLISYFMIGLQLNAAKFFIFFLTLFLTTLDGAAIVFAISASVSVVAIGNLLCILIFIVMMIFGGFFVNLASMPAWLSWLQYLSVIRYSVNALLINELDGESFYTTYSNGTYVTNPSGSYVVAVTGAEYLTSQGIAYQTAWDFWQNIMALGLIAIGVFVLAYLQLRRMKKLK